MRKMNLIRLNRFIFSLNFSFMQENYSFSYVYGVPIKTSKVSFPKVSILQTKQSPSDSKREFLRRPLQAWSLERVTEHIVELEIMVRKATIMDWSTSLQE